jgi:alpha-glucosidase
MKTVKLLIIILLPFYFNSLLAQNRVHDIQRNYNTLSISLGENKLLLEVCKDNIIMVNFVTKGKTAPDLPIIEKKVWHKTVFNYTYGEKGVIIKTKSMSLFIQKDPFLLYFTNLKDTILKGPLNYDFKNENIIFNSAGKNFYGISNRQQGNLTSNEGDTIRAGEQGQAGGPFLWTTKGYGLLFNSDGGKILIKNGDITFQNAKNTESNFKFYILTGSPEEIFTALTDITGKPPLFPKWSMGFMNTEWGIDQEELFTHIKNYREKDIPLDGFILDFDWMDWGNDNYGEFTWGPKFPDAANGKLKSMLENYGVKLCGIRKPRIHTGTTQGKYADEHKFFFNYETDYFSKKKVGLLDFYKPEVQNWYWDCFINKGNSYSNGISGYWNDEADAYGGNFMFTYMQKCQYEGQRKYNKDRVFSLNRNYYTGNQKYAYAHWSGDIHTGFKSMAEQRLFMLSSVNLGSGWWSMDIAGFIGQPTDEIYSRWMQFGAFVPVYRVHATQNKQRQPWFYGKEAEETAVKYIRLRYELMPYIYSYAWKNHLTGVSITKPLIFNYPDDEKVSNLYSEFLFGDEILVSPVVSDNKEEKFEVYLPKGDWYNYWSGQKHSGEQNLRYSCEEKDIPVFIKAGAIIPKQKYGKNVYDTLANKRLILDCYAGPDGSFTLYEDDGKTYNYEKGEYSLTIFKQKTNENRRTLQIINNKTGYISNIKEYHVNFCQVGSEPKEVLLNDSRIIKQNNADFNSNGWFFDPEKKICIIRVKYTDYPKSVVLVF